MHPEQHEQPRADRGDGLAARGHRRGAHPLDNGSHAGQRTLLRVAAVDVIDAYIKALPGEGRRLAHGEWGLRVPAESAGGWPLDVGMRIHEGLLRVQAFALGADDRINPWNFLHWNRGTRLVRFAC